CATLSDCPKGEFCVQHVCKSLPCDGTCADDEVCVQDACQAADGFDCSTDSSVCPSAFTCTGQGTCARSCSDDTDCVTPGYKSCNPDTGVCGQCTFDDDCDQQGTTRFCNATTATCVACAKDEDCYENGAGAGKICDPTSSACVA